MTVKRYKRDVSLKDVLLGVTRHEPSKPAEAAAPAKTADVAKPAPATGAPAATKVMRINNELRARIKRGGRRHETEPSPLAEKLFNAYQPPPGVLPKSDAGKDKIATLGMDSALSSWANDSLSSGFIAANPFGAAFVEGVSFMGYAYLSELTQRPEYRRISERIATEMTRKWITLTSAGEAQDDEEREDEEDLFDLERDDKDGEEGEESDSEKDKGVDSGQAQDARTTLAVHHDDSDDVDAEETSGSETSEEGDPEIGPEAEEDEDEPLVDDAQQKRNDALRQKIKEINEDLVKFGIRDKFQKVAEHDGWFGRSHLYVDLVMGKGEKPEGEEAGGDAPRAETKNRVSDDPTELASDMGNSSDAISKDKVFKGSLRGFKVIEPIWCYPIGYNANDPFNDDWYNPQVWYVFSKPTHASRLLTFVGREVPDLLKPAYAFGGLSMSQMAKPYIDNWLRTRQAVTNLIESFSVSGVYTNAQSLLQGGGEEVIDRIELFTLGRNNMGTMVLDKDQEEFFNISTPLGTLDALQAQSQEQMSSVTGIPLIVLLGITPTGLNASSEGELRVFYDLIHAMQEHLFREKLTRVINFIQLNRYGEIDPAIGFEFEPLWSLDEKGQAEVDKINAETHMVYVDGGVIDPAEVRKIIIDMPDQPYTGLDPNDVPEPPEADPMGGGLPGAGGKTPMGGGGSTESETQAADELTGEIEEVAPDVFALDARPTPERVTIALDAWEEHKHPRVKGGENSGQFAPGGGSSSGSANGPEGQKFKSKKDHIGHLLLNGTTPKDLMKAMGWPSVSMPAQAKSLGMKLEKKDGKYFGVKMTAEELAAAKKTDAEKKQASAAGLTHKIEEPPPVKTGLEDLTEAEVASYETFLSEIKKYAAKGEKENVVSMFKYNPKQAALFAKLSDNKELNASIDKLVSKKPAPPKPAEKKVDAPKATPQELEKAKKATTLGINLVPGEKPGLAGSPQMKQAQELVTGFNALYANKQLTDPIELAKKVDAFKDLTAKVNELGKQEAAKKNEIDAEAKKKAQQEAQKQAAVAAEQAKKSAESNKKMMAELGISDQQAQGVHELAKMLGATDGDLTTKFKAYAKQAEQYGYPITGFQCALIKNYSNGGYQQVNDKLRSGAWSKSQHAYVAMVNSALSKMPAHTGKLTRGASLTAEQQARYLEGHIVQEHAFTSTSTGKGFGGNTTFKVTAIGKRGHDIKKLSNHPGESEVLFQARTYFHVSKVEGKPGGPMTIHLEEWEE